MEAVERCRFCREPLNEGAVVCASCRRRQARPRAARAAVLVVVVALVAAMVWAVVVLPARTERENRSRVECIVSGC